MNFKCLPSIAWLASLAGALALPSGCLEDTISPKLFGEIGGEVLAEDGGAPVAQATVTTNPPTSTVVTDADGRFVLPDVPEGTYALRTSSEGFVPGVTSVAVSGDRTSTVVVRLRTDSAANSAPATPVATFPEDGARALPTSLTFSWSATDADADDDLRYTVTLFEGGAAAGRLLAREVADTSAAVDDLRYGTTYRWQVSVTDGTAAPVLSPVATFTTRDVPDYRILFARTDGTRYDLYATDGLEEIRLTDGGPSNWRPRMNPQRTRVAFISNENVGPQLYTVARDGSDRRRVTEVPLSGADLLELDFAWSPDGTKLLYPGGANLYEVNADGSGLRVYARAPFGSTFAGCDWSGRATPGVIARLTGTSAYAASVVRVDADGNLSPLLPDEPGALSSARLSVAGTEVLYSRDMSGFESLGGRQLNARVFVRDIASGATADLSTGKAAGTNDLDPVYSPDGARVLLVNVNNDGLSRGDLYVVGADGEERTLLIGDAVMPDWR